MLDDKRIHDINKVTGLTARRNKGGFVVVSCHYSADPNKNEDWVKKTKLGYPETSWDREFEMSRETQEGQRVYPLFTKTIHCPTTLEQDPNEVIYRGWDFGFHHPAVVWLQLNHRDQMVVLGELMGNETSIEDFVEDVRKQEHEWFCYHGREHRAFADWGDPAGNQRSDKSSGSMIKDENTTINVLRNFKIRVQTKRFRVETRINLIRSLMGLRKDTRPGIIFDSVRCPILTQGFLGGYVCEEDKSTGAPKEAPKKDGYYDHIQDALQYVVCGVMNPKTRKIAGAYTSAFEEDRRSYDEKQWAYHKDKAKSMRRNWGGGTSRVTGY